MPLFASYLELKYMGKNDVILLAKITVSSQKSMLFEEFHSLCSTLFVKIKLLILHLKKNYVIICIYNFHSYTYRLIEECLSIFSLCIPLNQFYFMFIVKGLLPLTVLRGVHLIVAVCCPWKLSVIFHFPLFIAHFPCQWK